MRNLLKLEEAAIFAGTLIAFYGAFPGPWWVFLLLLLTPDLGMLGYLGGPRLGALTYNLVHHRGIAVAIYFLGVYLENPLVIWIGLIIFLHSTLDRVFGYGLKYPDSFQNTHLGPIGPAARKA
ncbi:MAG: DUF4260 domain-containing protein [Anaerolineales bacterium]